MGVSRKMRIGLALGGGAARGWAHVGVIRVLEQAGIKPDIVCGTSIGALVGATYAEGNLDSFEEWLAKLGIKDMVSLVDVRMNGGMIKGEKLMDFFRRSFVDRPIEELDIPFAAIATDLHTGSEVWLREGSATEAVRASIAIPGLFAPAVHEGRMLVDGGLSNPVPVSVARAMGADIVIAVDLNSDLIGRHLHDKPKPESGQESENNEETQTSEIGEWIRKLQENLSAYIPSSSNDEPELPSMLDVIANSINIMQVRITRSRMAGEPPDVIVTPRLARLGLLDFHRSEEAIAEGKRAMAAELPELKALLK